MSEKRDNGENEGPAVYFSYPFPPLSLSTPFQHTLMQPTRGLARGAGATPTTAALPAQRRLGSVGSRAVVPLAPASPPASNTG